MIPIKDNYNGTMFTGSNPSDSQLKIRPLSCFIVEIKVSLVLNLEIRSLGGDLTR